jgi:hypothetical protein
MAGRGSRAVMNLSEEVLELELPCDDHAPSAVRHALSDVSDASWAIGDAMLVVASWSRTRFDIPAARKITRFRSASAYATNAFLSPFAIRGSQAGQPRYGTTPLSEASACKAWPSWHISGAQNARTAIAFGPKFSHPPNRQTARGLFGNFPRERCRADPGSRRRSARASSRDVRRLDQRPHGSSKAPLFQEVIVIIFVCRVPGAADAEPGS